MTSLYSSSNKMTRVDSSNMTSLYSSSQKMTSLYSSSDEMTSLYSSSDEMTSLHSSNMTSDCPSYKLSGMSYTSNSSNRSDGSGRYSRSSYYVMNLSVFDRGNHVFSFDCVNIVYVNWSY